MHQALLQSGSIILLFCLFVLPAGALGHLEVPDRPVMTAWEEKISSDLLPLFDERFLLPGETREGAAREIVRQTGINETVTDEVFVSIQTTESAPAGDLEPWCLEITDRDEERHQVAARVRISVIPYLARERWIRSIRTIIPPVAETGSTVTEGDQIHRSDRLRTITGLSGQGMKIGVISTGVDHWQDALNSGDLPATLHILSNAVSGDEGTAMLEIIADIAPGADLYFSDTGTNTIAFRRAVDALVNAGCRVIVDDITWPGEPFFEDGPVATHVREMVQNAGLVYITSAGNYARRHYQGSYCNDGNGWQDFSGGRSGSRKGIYVSIPPGGNVRAVLQWDDPFGSSGNDYDLYLVEQSPESGVILRRSVNIQDGDADPLEWFTYTNDRTTTITGELGVRNVMDQASSRTLELQLSTSQGASISPDNLVAADSISGQAAVPDVLTVGALRPTDPSQLEPFSSRGPVTIVHPDRETRQKPDICGIDGVAVTGAGGFPVQFFGTSAAAPHIAGIAALLWSIHPSLTPDQIRDALSDGAVDLGEPGRDTLFGTGRADALASEGAIRTDGPVMVSGPTVIDSPGVYLLDRDITDCQNTVCIEIQSSNVILDGQGHLLAGVMRDGTAGIFVSKSSEIPLTNVTVKNITVTRWAYGVYYLNADSGEIRTIRAANNQHFGIVLYAGSSGNTIADTILDSNGDGIVLTTSTDQNTVMNATVRGNRDHGISLYHADGTLLESNKITGATTCGVMLALSNSTIVTGCSITGDTRYGVLISHADTNLLTNNTIAGSLDTGIYLDQSSGNRIYNNYFNNNLNAFVKGISTANTWNHEPAAGINIVTGPSIGGNYWSTPQGNGFSETHADSDHDGLCDEDFPIPTELDGDNTDRAPLVKPSIRPIIPILSQTLAPTDRNGDGRYEDLNGNGRSDYGDVVLFFDHLDWIAEHEPVDAFDFNRNGTIDFTDVVVLFTSL